MNHHVLFRSAALATLLAVVSICLTAQSPKSLEPLKALYVGGGCCHDYDTQKLLIKAGLEARANIKVDIVHQGGSSTDAKIPLYENADWAKGYDVVLHHECFAEVKDKAFVDTILKPHKEGVPAVLIHCAMHCYRVDDDRWFKFCGVRSHGHGPHYPHEVLNVNAAHPVMKTFPAGWWSPQGELYRVSEVYDKTTPLATSKDQKTGEDHATIWTNDYHGTRVFGTTLGHHNEVFEAPEFMDMLTRGTLWAADKLDDTHLKDYAPAPRIEKVDLAQGKTATASSEEKNRNNLAPNAFDGKDGTRWCASGGGFPQWLQVDLGMPQKVTGAELVWESKNNAYQHKISVSSDGTNWREIVNAEDAKGGGINTHAFETQHVRHLKVEVLGSSGGGWASIRQFKVLGTETREVQPAAAGRR